MFGFDVDLSTVVNGGAGLCALYLAMQIKAMLQAMKTELKDLRNDHTALEVRVLALETGALSVTQSTQSH